MLVPGGCTEIPRRPNSDPTQTLVDGSAGASTLVDHGLLEEPGSFQEAGQLQPGDAGPPQLDTTPPATGGLPQGNTGIAAKYKGDVNIASDPAVIFADDFESYSSVSGLTSKWDSLYHSGNFSIVTAAANVYRGQKAVEIRVPQSSQEVSNALVKLVNPERDVLFLRFHSKFETSFDAFDSTHHGGSISAHYYNNGQATPGVPANGTNTFLVNYECFRDQASTPSPGELNIYIYHPEQRSQWGDHFFPTGTVLPNSSQSHDFGPTFVSRPNVVPTLGQWHSYEFMVKANTPGQRDGRIALWYDGKLIADFPNLRLRDVSSLKIDHFELDMHIGSNTGGATKKWYDNVVAATSYIGPLVD